MTRINAGIPVTTLCDQHLLAEAREIKRIPNVVASGKYNLTNQPKQFTLGTGHVKFFYNRQKYLLDRYKAIYSECIARGFNVQDFSGAWDNVPSQLMNDYKPTSEAIELLTIRISERLQGMKQVKYTTK